MGPGEKQGAKPQDDHIWTHSPFFFLWLSRACLESICSASPQTQVLTIPPQKEERSPNSARECSAWWERWGHLLMRFTGSCSCSQQHQPILQMSRKANFLANFLWLGQSWSQGRAVRKKEHGKGPCYGEHCPLSDVNWMLPALLSGSLISHCGPNQGSCPKVPILTIALTSKTHWLPNSFPVADWEADCIFPHFASWWPGALRPI